MPGSTPVDDGLFEFDTITDPLGTGSHTLGVLGVDFGPLGLSPGQPYTVSIAGQESVGGVQEPGNPPSFTFATPTFAPPERKFIPTDVVIPEPITLTCALVSVGAVGGYVRRRRLA